MIPLTQILKMSENSSLCTHFLETRKKAKHRTTMSWLSTCDIDTLYLINQTITKLASESTSENISVENVGTDIFDEAESFQSRFTLDLSSEDSNDETDSMDEPTEVMCLTALLLFWERHTDELEEEMVIGASEELAIMSMIETLRREGLVTISGSGKFFDPDNMANPIKNAKKTAKKILKKTSAK